MIAEASKSRLRLAAQEFESALNAYSYPVDISIGKIEVTAIGDIRPKHCFNIVIEVTEPTQIYP